MKITLEIPDIVVERALQDYVDQFEEVEDDQTAVAEEVGWAVVEQLFEYNEYENVLSVEAGPDGTVEIQDIREDHNKHIKSNGDKND